MGRVFIMPLGFHEDRAMRMFIENSVTERDRVYIITANKTLSVVRAYESLVAFCRKIRLPDPELVEVPMDLSGGISRILQILRETDGEVVVDLSRGMRYLIVYTLIALLLSNRTATIHIQPESGEATEIVIPKQLLEVARNPPRGLYIEILRVVSESEGASVEEISRALGKSAKTVTNCLTKLGKLKLVSRRGRERGIYLTDLGKLVLALTGG